MLLTCDCAFIPLVLSGTNVQLKQRRLHITSSLMIAHFDVVKDGPTDSGSRLPSSSLRLFAGSQEGLNRSI
jgi:hypothetical protein